jgi:RecD/TraA family predicted helicase
MSLKVKLIPIREIFFNPSNGFRVLGCEPVSSDEVVLNKYGNFTLSGSNLSTFNIGEEYKLEIREDKRSKYAGSYILIGFSDININENGITIKPEQELTILSHICEGEQPNYIHDAYPNFVQLVLDGKEEEIDYKQIYNVGPVRFEEYVNKIKGYFNTIQFLPITSNWGIDKDTDIDKLIKTFATSAELNQALESSPYHIFFDLLNYSFDKSDRYVLDKRPDLIDSKERCEFACLAILQENENEGDTRIYTDLFEELAEEKVPECAKYVKDAVRNSERIYYDAEQEYSSNKATYEAEVNIAENIKERLKAPNFFEDKTLPDFEQYRNIDGFNCTDEQMQILHEVWDKNIAMLTGGAGTGKTSSMKSVIKIFDDNHIDYLLLAPTGIAMKRLKESTGRSAYTIHMALACGITKDFQGVLVIEESSMVSVHLLSMLLTEVDKKCKILFICDPAQLASISCGNVVQDIIDSGVVSISQLTKVFRYGTSGLATIATDTRNGELGPRQNSTFSDYQFVPINDKPIKQILDSYQTLLDKYNKDDIMILSPFNKGPVGTVAINKAIQFRYNPNPDTKAIRKSSSGEEIMFKIGDKVINTHNEYNMPCFLTDDDGSLVESTDRTISVMNGDIGYVRYIKETDRGIIMAVEFDTGMAQVYGPYMNNLLLGYSISTHKSQGSESKAVIVITSPMHKRLLSSNLLYVADSRAKEQLIEIGDVETIKEGLKRHENKERNTWLCELLKEE